MRCGDSLRTGVSDLPSSRTFAFTCGASLAPLFCEGGETQNNAKSGEVMKQEIVTFAGMQADHRRWDYVHSTWRVNIERWQGEHESALSKLAKLQGMIRQHGESLESQVQAIQRHQQGLRDHGRATSEYQNQGPGGPLRETMAISIASMPNDTKPNSKPTSGSRSTITP